MIDQNTFYWVGLAALGLVFGSFNTVLISRLPVGQSIGGRSRCSHCGHQLRWFENIPLASYLALKGRCSRCKIAISWAYPAIELATSVAVLLVVTSYKTPILAVLALISAVFGVALTAIDFRHFRLPNALTYSLAGTTFLGLFAESLVSGNFTSFMSAALGSLFITGFYLILWFFFRGMGLGDVKYALSIGAFSAYFGYLNLYIAGLLSLISASVFAVFSLIFRGANRKSSIAFGPFIFFGFVLAPYLTPLIKNFLHL